MSIIRSSQEVIQEYYDSIGINRTAIKTILHSGMQVFLAEAEEAIHAEKSYEEKTHFILGSALDCKLTEGEDIFNQKYYHSILQRKPADKPAAIVRMVYDAAIKKEVEDEEIRGDEGWKVSNILRDQENLIYEAMNTVQLPADKVPGYYMNNAKSIAEDTRMDNRLLKDGLCQAYWEDLLSARGKQVLSDEQYNCINDMYMSLTTHPFTKDLFKDGEDIDILYQYPIYWEEEIGDDLVLCKILVDTIRILHNVEYIIPFDIKTFGNYVTRFNTEMHSRRYDLQGSFYTHGIKKDLANISRLIGKDVTNYKIANFGFVVESTLLSGTPLKYIMSDSLLYIGEHGSEEPKRKGWREGLQIYSNWRKNEFDISKLSSNGVVIIDENFNKVNSLL